MTGSSGPGRYAQKAALVFLLVLAMLAIGLVLGNPAGAGRLLEGLFGESAGRGAELALTDLAGFFDRYLGENAAGEVLLVLLLGALALVFAAPRSGQLRAVLGTSFKEIRRGGALWVVLIAGLLLAVGAPLLEAEGGPAGRVKMILSVTMGLASLVGTLLAVALPALSFSREMETRSIYVAVAKPVPRWVIFTGKLCGVALALAIAAAGMGLGAFVAANLALAGEARRARAAGGNPEHAWLAAGFRRDARPALERRPGEKPPRAEILRGGQKRTLLVEVPESERAGRWLVLRLYAGPIDPRIQSAPAVVRCGGKTYPTSANRSLPVDVVVPSSAARTGELEVTLEPVADLEGVHRGLRLDPRGAVGLAARGNGLVTTLFKSLALVWLQLLVVAAVTTTAAGVMSFPVAAVSGAAAALAGHLSGLAVSILRGALLRGKQIAAGHVHGPACGHEGCGHDHGAVEVTAAGQLVRQEIAGLLSVLPDFDATSASGFLAAGDYVPWRFIAAGAVSLMLLRTVPVALLGCLAFSRREVGA